MILFHTSNPTANCNIGCAWNFLFGPVELKTACEVFFSMSKEGNARKKSKKEGEREISREVSGTSSLTRTDYRNIIRTTPIIVIEKSTKTARICMRRRRKTERNGQPGTCRTKLATPRRQTDGI
jgi:hypothetical protein